MPAPLPLITAGVLLMRWARRVERLFGPEQAVAVRRYSPPRVVEVLHDDACWYRGLQDGWLWWADQQAWMASVQYSVAPGMKYSRSVPAERVRLPSS